MKSNILKYGLISGGITMVFMLISFSMMDNKTVSTNAEIIGYVGMLIAFVFLVLGMVKERQHLNGKISYLRALSVGLQITFIASVIYVATWMILTAIKPDIVQDMFEMMAQNLKAKNLSKADYLDQMEQMSKWKEYYKNPLLKAFFTFIEIFPVGLAISLVSALFIKSRPSISAS